MSRVEIFTQEILSTVGVERDSSRIKNLSELLNGHINSSRDSWWERISANHGEILPVIFCLLLEIRGPWQI